MDRKEFDNLGKNVQDIIDRAVNSRDYQKLNQTINQVVGQAMDSGGEALREAFSGAVRSAQKAAPQKRENNFVKTKQLYGKPTGTQVSGILMTVFGGILTCGMGLGLFLTGLFGAVGITEHILAVPLILLGMGTTAGALLLTTGIRRLCRYSRFRRYVRALGKNTYCNFEQLARAVGKSLKYAKKDVRRMIRKGWFPEGHVDEQETCLITSNETYAQYLETQKALERRQKEQKPGVEISGKVSPQVQEVLDRGNAFLLEIRRCNDAIPGEEISDKISRMELIVQKIFERAGEHPEIIPDLKRLMDYYLPMTVKLLHAYEDMDSQPVQGENICASKREIEATIDTLNQAFEKLLDSVFKDTAMDVSSDISVLHMVLAQEGLTEDDFARMQREAGGNGR